VPGTPLDETRYLQLAHATFKRIQDALDEVDPSDVDIDSAGDVLTLTLKDGVRCIVNTQRPTRQVWLAARTRAWHFDWDEAGHRWVDDKGTGAELLSTLEEIVRTGAGITVKF
jgi:CyaY protein